MVMIFFLLFRYELQHHTKIVTTTKFGMHSDKHFVFCFTCLREG